MAAVALPSDKPSSESPSRRRWTACLAHRLGMGDGSGPLEAQQVVFRAQGSVGIMGTGLGKQSTSLRVLCKTGAPWGPGWGGNAWGRCTGIRTHLWLGRAVGASRGQEICGQALISSHMSAVVLPFLRQMRSGDTKPPCSLLLPNDLVLEKQLRGSEGPRAKLKFAEWTSYPSKPGCNVTTS